MPTNSCECSHAALVESGSCGSSIKSAVDGFTGKRSSPSCRQVSACSSTCERPPEMLGVVVMGSRKMRACSPSLMRMNEHPIDVRTAELFTPWMFTRAGTASA